MRLKKIENKGNMESAIFEIVVRGEIIGDIKRYNGDWIIRDYNDNNKIVIIEKTRKEALESWGL